MANSSSSDNPRYDEPAAAMAVFTAIVWAVMSRAMIASRRSGPAQNTPSPGIMTTRGLGAKGSTPAGMAPAYLPRYAV